MVFGMTLDQQIKAAQKALEELTADEAELSRLQSEQVAEIASLKASGSKDFAGLAILEGKRAALVSMLGEQRASIDTARALLVSLEAQAHRDAVLSQIGEKATQIEAAWNDRQAHIVTLRDALPGLLLPILEDVSRWRKAREEWVNLAVEAGTPVLAAQVMGGGQAAEEQAHALYAELEARGVNTEALRWTPPGNPYEVVRSIMRPRDPLPPSTSPLAGELDWLIPELIGHANAAQMRAAGQVSGNIGGWGPSIVTPEALASTAYAPPEQPRTPDQSFTILPTS